MTQSRSSSNAFLVYPVIISLVQSEPATFMWKKGALAVFLRDKEVYKFLHNNCQAQAALLLRKARRRKTLSLGVKWGIDFGG